MTVPADPTELAAHVLDLARGHGDAQALVRHVRQGLTRFANSRIHQHVGEDTVTVRLDLQRDGRAASSETSRVTDDGLEALVAATRAQLDASPEDPGLPDLIQPTEVRPLNHIDPSTTGAEPDHRAEIVAAFVDAGPGFDVAGYVESLHTVATLANSHGHAARDETTRATLDGIHRDGVAAGQGHHTDRALSAIDGQAAGARAADLARRSQDTVPFDPGAVPVVLSPEAVASIMIFLGVYGFNGKAIEEGRSFVRIDEPQFDPGFSLCDDVTDPRSTWDGFDLEGTPKQRLDLVQDGRSVGIAHDRRTASRAGTASTGHAIPGSRSMGPVPTALVMPGGNEEVSDLVGSIEHGLFVTAFNYCRVLDPRTLVVTGLTRNGTFLIKDGQLGPAVDNLRFTQSFVDALGPGQIAGIGNDDRHADCEFGPGLVIAPSLSLASWNFTGGASG